MRACPDAQTNAQIATQDDAAGSVALGTVSRRTIERLAILATASDSRVHSGFQLRIGARGRRNRWGEPHSGFPARHIPNDEAIEGRLVSIEEAAASGLQASTRPLPPRAP